MTLFPPASGHSLQGSRGPRFRTARGSEGCHGHPDVSARLSDLAARASAQAIHGKLLGEWI
jgi:hypothetical protein